MRRGLQGLSNSVRQSYAAVGGKGSYYNLAAVS